MNKIKEISIKAIYFSIYLFSIIDLFHIFTTVALLLFSFLFLFYNRSFVKIKVEDNFMIMTINYIYVLIINT